MPRGVAALFTVWIYAFGLPFVFAQEGHETKMYHHKKNMQHRHMMEEKGDKAKAKVEDLTQRLNLTADQEARIREILARTHNEAKSILEEAKNKAREIRSNGHEEINNLLNEEQKKKFQETRQKHEAMPKAEE